MTKQTVCLITILFLWVSWAQADETKKWESLFDGKTLSGWVDEKGEPIEKGWTVRDGAIFLEKPRDAENIYTKESYEDFEFEFDWKISVSGNSGVKYRVKTFDGKILGIEYQVLDDQRHPDRELASHRSASFYDLKAAFDDKPIKPVGEWNNARIVAKGTKLEHYLNGKLVVAIDQASEEWKTRFQASKYRKYKGFGFGNGKIMLQDHNDQVWFRNLRIRRL